MGKFLTADSPFVINMVKMYERFVKALYNFGDCDFYADKISKWDKKNSQPCGLTLHFRCVVDSCALVMPIYGLII